MYILLYKKKSNVGKCISLKMQILLKRDQLTRNVLRSPLKHVCLTSESTPQFFIPTCFC